MQLTLIASLALVFILFVVRLNEKFMSTRFSGRLANRAPRHLCICCACNTLSVHVWRKHYYVCPLTICTNVLVSLPPFRLARALEHVLCTNYTCTCTAQALLCKHLAICTNVFVFLQPFRLVETMVHVLCAQNKHVHVWRTHCYASI